MQRVHLIGKMVAVMKKFYSLLLAAVALFGFAACTQDNSDVNVGEKATMTVYAVFESDDTRMALADNGITPTWEAGDNIYINDVVFTAKANGDNVAFTTTSEALPTGAYTAVYRGAESANAICAVQQAVVNSFPKQTPVVAAGEAIEEGSTLSFKNVASLLQFKALESGDYTFKAVGGEKFAAAFTINADATVTFAAEGSNVVTLKGCEVGKTYVVAVAPVTLSEGLEVSIGEEVVKTGGVGMVLERSVIYPLGDLGSVENFEGFEWGLAGAHQGWSVDNVTPMLETDIENLYVAENVTLVSPGFKFAKHGLANWEGENTTFGAYAVTEDLEYFDFTATMGNGWYEVYDNNLGEQTVDIGVTDFTKNYDIYIYVAEKADWGNRLQYTVVEHGTEITMPGEEPEPENPENPETPEMPEAGTQSAFGVVGSFQGWDVANPVAMYSDGEAWYVSEEIELYRGDEFKFAKDNSWDVSAGFAESVFAEVDTEYTLTTDNSQNIKVSKNGIFKMYINADATKFYYESVTEYTDLTVNITIDNKANWSPLYITLKRGDTTIVDNATVTDNKYAVSGDYIGETLSYVLSNGSKSLEGNVSITKNGATINLEETIIKLKVQLDTDNSKQWWGTTMKIHVWSTGTSLDTSWPGVEMTSEGDYTWSINVPSELVGKTINYLVHNGNGWQSKDSKVTISAEGNTVLGSSIGIE